MSYPYKAVIVHWHDAYMHDVHFTDEDLEAPSKTYTIGWLVKDAKEYIAVCRDVYPPERDEYIGHSFLIIPRTYITEMVYINAI